MDPNLQQTPYPSSPAVGASPQPTGTSSPMPPFLPQSGVAASCCSIAVLNEVLGTVLLSLGLPRHDELLFCILVAQP